MTKTSRFTKSEEMANSISHGFGALFGLAALVLMIIFASIKGNGMAHCQLFNLWSHIIYSVSFFHLKSFIKSRKSQRFLS
jgi:hemolysin III